MWFWYALAGALVGAIEIVLNKKTLNKVGAPLLTWSMFSLSLPLVALLTYFQRPITIGPLFWLGTLASSAIFVFGKTMSNQSISQGTLSKIFPLNSLTVLFTYIFGLIFLGELISPPAILGLAVVLAGVYLLNIESVHEGFLQPFKLLAKEKTSFIFIVAMVLFSLSGIFDKIALKNSWPENPLPALLVEDVLMSIFLASYMTRKDRSWIKELKQNFGLLSLNSFIYMISNILTFLAFLSGTVALSGGIKKFQVLFVLVIGYFFLKDRPPKHAWLAASIMVLGAVVIYLSTL